MLWVAFSRRMCCSRVCRARTKPRRPSTSVGLAGDPARHAADLLLGRAEEAERGAAEVEPVAERLALAEGDVGAALARRPEDAERHRVARRRPAARRAPWRPRRAPRRPRPRRGSSGSAGRPRRSRRRPPSASAAASVTPALEPDLDDLGAVADRVGGERLAAVRVDAAGDDEAAALGRAHRQVAGRGDRGGPLVEAGVGDRQPGQLRHRGLELEHHLQPALGDLRLVGRVGGEELGALGDRVDDRRHVVVVHPGAEEADLAPRRRRCARRAPRSRS